MPLLHWKNEFFLNNNAAGFQQLSIFGGASALLPGGSFVTTWQSLGDATPGAIEAQFWNADRTQFGTSFAVDVSETLFDSQVAALANGQMVFGFGLSVVSGDLDIAGKLVSATGNTSNALYTVNTTTMGFQENAALATLNDGRIAWVWTDRGVGDGSGSAIRMRVMNPDGTSAMMNDVIVNTTTAHGQISPNVAAMADGGFVVSWRSQNDAAGTNNTVMARIYEANGSAGAELVVASTTFTPNATDVTMLSNGRFLVAWYGTIDPVFSTLTAAARIYNANGTPFTDVFTLALDTAGGSVGNAVVTALSGGRFLAAWTETAQPGGSIGAYDVVARVFNANGTPDGDEILVNTLTTGSQYNISATTLTDGRVLISWQSAPDPSDSSISNVMGQIVDPRGANISGNNFSNAIYANDFNEKVSGLGGNDRLFGLDGDDWLLGGEGSDRLTAGNGNDTLYGENGNDVLIGGIGNDLIRGNDGADLISGGGGIDILSGNADNDIFVFAEQPVAANLDRINDFTSGADKLQFDASLLGGGLVAGGGVVLVSGVAPTAAGLSGGVFLYNTGNGLLSFDADGQGAGAANAVVRLFGAPTLLISDFIIVA
jgi:Ca2+-binding RTX toxin-like protein